MDMSAGYGAEIFNSKDLEISREFEDTQRSLSELSRDVEQSVHKSDEVAILKKYGIVGDDGLEKIGREEAEQWLKIIRTNYPSNIEEMPSDLQDVVKYLEAFVESSGRGMDNGDSGSHVMLSELTSQENAELRKLVNISKTPNNINYIENPTYKKYLNNVERELKLPRFALESICDVESGGKLYLNGKNITGSGKGAQGLFQFMPDTTKLYMKHPELKQYYGRTFSSSTEFLKDPLATAWAAGIMMNTFMKDYDFQTSLACYNWGEGNYQTRILGKKKGKKLEESKKRNLTIDDLPKLPGETRNYVKEVTKKVLEKNSLPYSDDSDVFANLGNCTWSSEGLDGTSIV